MIRTTLRRLMTLHFTHNGFTDARTFIPHLSFDSEGDARRLGHGM